MYCTAAKKIPRHPVTALAPTHLLRLTFFSSNSLVSLPNSTMAAGSIKKYALDLNDTFAFPDGNNIPLRPPNTKEGESWVMLLEVGLPSAVSNAVLCGDMDFHSAKR
jgi:hypothetical protein